MEPPHPLKSLLQLQLATDSSAVLHLPYVISCLTPDCFLPSPHLSKWTTRITSLLHSKDPGSRWAGLCLAHTTSNLSKETMIECSQTWLGIALPMLSRDEPLPAMKGAIRLSRTILTTGIGIPEFQRQVATPNVPNFTAAVIGLADKPIDDELKTLARLIPLYPTLNRASHTSLSNISLRYLNGNAPNPTNGGLMEAASLLYSVLPLTGGKVGAANLWKKAVEETIGFGWNAFLAVRTTFPSGARSSIHQATNGDPQTTIPLNIDKLRCCTAVLRNLLRFTTHRPIQIPLGPSVQFVSALLSCSKDEKEGSILDPSVRIMEESVVPSIWMIGCDLLASLAKCARHHLTPNLTRLISYLTFHLEKKLLSSQRLKFLTTVQILLFHCHLIDSPPLLSRLTRAILPSISAIFATSSDLRSIEDGTAISTKAKKGKKRARGYEGDEIFKLSRGVICSTNDDGDVLLAAFDVLQMLLRNHSLSPALQSMSSRMIIYIQLALPHIPPAILSPDLNLHKKLLQKVHTITRELGSGTTNVMSKSLNLVIRTALGDEDHDGFLRHLDILLHPRVPPLVRSLPHVESLSLFREEEPEEESELRRTLGLHDSNPDQVPSAQELAIEADAIASSPKMNDKALGLRPATSVTIPTMTREFPATSPTVMTATAPPLSRTPLPEATVAPTSSKLPPMSTPINEDEDEEMPVIDLDSDSD